jgi:hypothetical protein
VVSDYSLTWCQKRSETVAFLGTFAKCENHLLASIMSVCPSVCVEQLSSHWMNFHEVDIRGLLKNLGTLLGGLCKFVISG